MGEAYARAEYLIAEMQASVTLPADWPTALGYAPWVEEVWINYLTNACKYGGRPPEIQLGAEALHDGRVRFWVRDNGNGVLPEDHDRLFKPFTRLEQARARGHGLGLSIVRRIIERQGGQVGVISHGVPGEGSEFYFTLPQAVNEDVS